MPRSEVEEEALLAPGQCQGAEEAEGGGHDERPAGREELKRFHVKAETNVGVRRGLTEILKALEPTSALVPAKDALAALLIKVCLYLSILKFIGLALLYIKAKTELQNVF